MRSIHAAGSVHLLRNHRILLIGTGGTHRCMRRRSDAGSQEQLWWRDESLHSRLLHPYFLPLLRPKLQYSQCQSTILTHVRGWTIGLCSSDIPCPSANLILSSRFAFRIEQGRASRADCGLVLSPDCSDGSADIPGGGGSVELNCPSSSGGLVGHMQQG